MIPVPECEHCGTPMKRIDADFIRAIKQNADGKWVLDELDRIEYSCYYCGNELQYNEEPLASILAETDS